jgi:cell division protein FtsZ
VNVTGANMTLGEFQDIGAVVSSFASDDATVVMGTAIDDTLGEELRVTVVATGLGAPQIAKKLEMNVVPRNTNGDVDYGQLEKPAVQRKNHNDRSGGYDESLLDIPAFLRRQAD